MSRPSHVEPREVQPAAAIVVLGARILPGGEPSGALRARVARGAELYHKAVAPWLVLTGGVGRFPPSEASVMLRVARSLGVPETACLIEDQSHSTYENAYYTARLLRQRGIDRVVLVTDSYHLFRARQHFRRQGIDAVPVAATMEDRGISTSAYAYCVAREFIALLLSPCLLVVRRPPASRSIRKPQAGGV